LEWAFGFRPTWDTGLLLVCAMEGNCEQCRILFKSASAAISEHAKAVSRLAEAVGKDSSNLLHRLNAAARRTKRRM